MSIAVGDKPVPYGPSEVAAAAGDLGWQFIPAAQLPRKQTDVLVERYLVAALVRLNPEIADAPDRADEGSDRLAARS